MITFAPNTRILSAEVNQNFTDLANGAGMTSNNSLLTFKKESVANHVVTGLVIPTSANLTTTISSGGVAVINGTRQSYSSITRTYTASKDTYVDLKDDGTVTYVEVANGATSGMTLTLNSDGSGALRIAKVVSSGSAITAVYQITQSGSAALSIGRNTDPLGNIIYPRTPRMPKIYNDYSGGVGFTFPTTATDIPNSTWTFIATRDCYLKYTYSGQADMTADTSTRDVNLDFVVDGVQVNYRYITNNGFNRRTVSVHGMVFVAAGSHVCKARAWSASGNILYYRMAEYELVGER